MNLAQALRLSNTPNLALVGAGGKTTALFQLARQLPPPVIVTATTHLHVDQIRMADAHYSIEQPADLVRLEESLRGVTLVTGPSQGTRTTGVSEALASGLHELCRRRSLPLLVEADGSRQRPLKAPMEYEPPIPDFVETVVVVAGLSGLGQLLTDEFVHRPEIFAHLGGLDIGEAITPEAVSRVLAHPDGGLKNIPAQARRIALLNQADTPELQSIGGNMAQKLLSTFDAVLVGSLQSQRLRTFERTAGIILAAGESSRLGQPKQLLEWRGRPFVRQVAETALSAGLSPVIIVTGANAEMTEAVIRDLPVKVIRNAEWQKGQSSSIRVGLTALTPSPLPMGEGRRGEGSAIFLLADQPQVPPTVLRALTERHSQDLSPIIAPLVAERRANPVLFDRVTFPDLMALRGDVGGRGIFSKYSPTYLPWHDESLLIDIDAPDDLERLKDL